MILTPGRRKPAFTLVEILAVVVILGILAAIVVPRVLVSSSSTKITACYKNKRDINASVERWYFYEGTWPLDALTDIAADAEYFPSGIPVCPVDSTAYALDAATHRVTGHAH